ncbi:MAG TPA: hypothetical protein DDW52_00145 [Planctomycetaceae bacterium]|nr:hypothetical protein [Planctomycetaceae bacterium]
MLVSVFILDTISYAPHAEFLMDTPNDDSTPFDDAVDRLAARLVSDTKAAEQELLAAFPDRRSEIECIVTSITSEPSSDSNTWPPLPSTSMPGAPGVGDVQPVRTSVRPVTHAADDTDRGRGSKGSTLSNLSDPTASSTLAPHQLPQRIGSYQLTEQIDSGGMGIVYKARSLTTADRTVAVKLIRPELLGREMVARFELECQSLALMSHPSIATIYEGGYTDDGVPFLAMEFVGGQAITQYCASEQLNLAARLQLFQQVCAGIEHAHQKGVIHRDLKPSNLLVTDTDGLPTPKVIDFGLAKLMPGGDPTINKRTSNTQLGQILGTLQYMSPEAATLRPTAIDTRSDVFSLGVILFELLTGTTPLAEQLDSDLPVDERLRRVRFQDPPRPSDRLSQVRRFAAQPTEGPDSTEVPDISAKFSLRGDLDSICLKALARETDERYASVAELSRDIDNYLAGHAVTAAATNSSYVFKKFVKRNRAALSLAAVVSAVLILATGLSVRWALLARTAQIGLASQLQIAVEARESESEALAVAKRQTATSAAINEFLRLDLLAQASPLSKSGRDVTLREVVDRAASAIENRFEDQPVVKGEILSTIASVYSDLGEHHTAYPIWQQARQLLTEHLDQPDSRILKVNRSMAASCLELGLHEQAKALLTSNLDATSSSPEEWSEDRRLTLKAMSSVQRWLGYQQEADALLAGQLLESVLSQDPAPVLENNWAVKLVREQKYSEALPLLESAYAQLSQLESSPSPTSLAAHSNLAYCLARLGRYDDALDRFEQIIETSEQILGPYHIETLNERQKLAHCLHLAGRNEFAIAQIRSLIQDAEEHDLSFSMKMIANNEILAECLFDDGEHQEGVECLTSFASAVARRLKPEHPASIQFLARASNAFNSHDKHAETLDLLGRHWDYNIGTATEPPPLPQMVLADRWLSATRGAESWEVLARATENLLKILPTDGDSWQIHRARVNYLRAEAFRAQDEYETAGELYSAAYAAQQSLLGPKHYSTLNSKWRLGDCLRMQSKYHEAEEVQWAALLTNVESFDTTKNRGRSLLASLNKIADHYRENEQYTASEELFRRLLSFCDEVLGPSHMDTIDNANGLGLTLRAQESLAHLDAAAELYGSVAQAAGDPLESNRSKYLPFLYNWALTLRDLERHSEAARCFERTAEETRTQYGQDYYRAERADVRAAECWIEHGDDSSACRLLLPLCEIDPATPPKNAATRLEAIDLLMKCTPEQDSEALAMKIEDVFQSIRGSKTLNAWEQSQLALAAAAAFRRLEDSPESLQNALRLNQAAVEIRANESPTHYRTANAYRSLGTAYEAVGDDQKAEAAYLKAYDILLIKPSPKSSYKRIVNTTIERLVSYYSRLGDDDSAQEWQDRIYSITP